jgi:hypothetical protein
MQRRRPLGAAGGSFVVKLAVSLILLSSKPLDAHSTKKLGPSLKIINGQDVSQPKAYPFMVSLTDQSKHKCGGTVSKSWMVRVKKRAGKGNVKALSAINYFYFYSFWHPI